jgi:peroxiredoxin
MFEPKKRAISPVLLSIWVIAICGMLAASGCKKDSVEAGNHDHNHNHDHDHNHNHDHEETAVVENNAETAAGNPEPAPTIPEPAVAPADKPEPVPAPVVHTEPKLSLQDVIRRARSWRPSNASWYGKPAPDFTVTDLSGNQHKLSDYRGKTVMLVFWATWCPPCMMEIPHIMSLRKEISEDDLAILAITYEEPELVKKFAQSKELNYTVALEQPNMPAPFGVMRIYKSSGIPGSFFINPDGTVKIGTSGLLSEADMRGIIEAQ